MIDQRLDDGSIKLQIATRQRIPQALFSSAIAVSDGRALIGHIVEIECTPVAVATDGVTIGTFGRRQEAFQAISAATAGRAA
jgi:hypothetical protein